MLDESQIDDGADDGSSIRLTHNQLMDLITKTQGVPQPKAPRAASPFQAQQPMPQSPQRLPGLVVPHDPNRPVSSLDPNAYMEPVQNATARTRIAAMEAQKQGGMAGAQPGAAGGPTTMSVEDAWKALREQNPNATPKQLWDTINAMGKAGALKPKVGAGGGAGGFIGQEYSRLLTTINPATGKLFTDAEALDKLQSFKRASPDEFGSREASKNKADIDPVTGKAVIAGGVAAATAGGKEGIKIAQNINDQADNALASNITLNHIKSLGKDVQLGKLADAKAGLSNWAQSLGLMDQKTADDAFGSAGSAQALTKAVIPLITQSLHQLSARPAVMEFQTYLRANPNIEQTPDGFQKVVEWMQRVNDLAIGKQEYFQKWKSEHGPEDYQDFSYAWNKKLSKDILGSSETDEPTAKTGKGAVNYTEYFKE